MGNSLIALLVAYCLGSLLFGVILSQKIKGVDIRTLDHPGGSGSIRRFGWRFGLTVGVLDALKGMAAVHIAQTLTGDPYVVILCAVAVVAGHNWPMFFSFRGGGGLAPAFGVILYHFPLEFGLGLVAALAMLGMYRRTPLRRWLPSIGPVPIAGVIGLLMTLALVWQRHGLFPGGALIIAMGFPIAMGGYAMLRRKPG